MSTLSFLVTYSLHYSTSCGGTAQALDDGTASTWHPGDDGFEGCETKCASSASCSGFLWRISDGYCFFRTGSDSSTTSAHGSYHCFQRDLGALASFAQFTPMLCPLILLFVYFA